MKREGESVWMEKRSTSGQIGRMEGGRVSETKRLEEWNQKERYLVLDAHDTDQFTCRVKTVLTVMPQALNWSMQICNRRFKTKAVKK